MFMYFVRLIKLHLEQMSMFYAWNKDIWIWNFLSSNENKIKKNQV